jgi:hypothetical protein
VLFNVTISFKQQQATVLLALPVEDYSAKPLKTLLPQLNLHAAKEVSGAYNIVGLLQGGARLDNAKALRVQGVPPGGVLSAIVTELNAVFARAAGKATAAPPEPAPPPDPAPPPEPTPAAPPQQGSAATSTGQKPGPRPGAPKVDKKTKPPLWTVGGALSIDGCDCGARMDRMAEKVEKAGGVPAAGDCAGHGICGASRAASCSRCRTRSTCTRGMCMWAPRSTREPPACAVRSSRRRLRSWRLAARNGWQSACRSGARCARSASRAAAPSEHAHRLCTRL